MQKTGNMLNRVARRMQPEVNARLHDIRMAPAKEHADRAFERFANAYEAKYLNAAGCLTKDRYALLCFSDLPAEHWQHLRTTSQIKSTFDAAYLRTTRTKRRGPRIAPLTIVLKLAQAAHRSWRTRNGHQCLTNDIRGVRFIGGNKDLAASSARDYFQSS